MHLIDCSQLGRIWLVRVLVVQNSEKKNGFLFTFFRQKKDEITPIYIIIYNVMGPLLWTLALSN
jgi:isoprenylcysteine carboxyl methyltransferase (ICMT) family protein YpbQ